MERGATPTPISLSLACVTASNAVTESLSWFTTHNLALPLAHGWNARVDEAFGRSLAGADTPSARRCGLPGCRDRRWP
jgi:hypothetical protein